MLVVRLTPGVSDINKIALVFNMGRDQGEMNPGTGNYIPGEGCPVLRGAWLRVSRQRLVAWARQAPLLLGLTKDSVALERNTV